MRPVCERLDKQKSLLLFVLLCVVIEIACSVINLPNALYRLLCLRYVMLIWFGWQWVKEGVKLNITTFIVSLLSLCCIIYLEYFVKDNEPWLFNTDWKTHRWMCYFWVSWLFVGILYWLYQTIKRYETIERIVKMLTSASYEVFLIQMAYYALVPMERLGFLRNEAAMFAVWFALAFLVSIAGGIWLYNVEKKYVLKQ